MSILTLALDLGGDALGTAFIAGSALSFFLLWRVLRSDALDGDEGADLRGPGSKSE